MSFIKKIYNYFNYSLWSIRLAIYVYQHDKRIKRIEDLILRMEAKKITLNNIDSINKFDDIINKLKECKINLIVQSEILFTHLLILSPNDFEEA